MNLPKLVEFIGWYFLKHVQHFSHQFLLNDFQQFVLLQHFTRNIQRQIVAVHEAPNEGQIFGQHILEVVRDEHPSDIQLKNV
jgi:hypothetical protein